MSKQSPEYRAMVERLLDLLPADIPKATEFAVGFNAAMQLVREEMPDALQAAQPTNPQDVGRLVDALQKAEAALADIGDADREPGDDLAWCEKRAADALPAVRAAIAAHKGEK